MDEYEHALVVEHAELVRLRSHVRECRRDLAPTFRHAGNPFPRPR
jgi:hypothetical protein